MGRRAMELLLDGTPDGGRHLVAMPLQRRGSIRMLHPAPTESVQP
jgi:hypothetical protein